MNLKMFRTLVRQSAAPMRHFIKDKSGNASIIFGLTSIPLAMIASMAVDYGNSVRIKNELQAAVDAGVLAAATAIANGEDDQSKTAIAESTFFANLSSDTLSGFTATPATTVNLPDKEVTMTVNVSNSRMISTLLSSHVDIGVTATAVVDPGNPICMLSLNKTTNEALYLNGTADLVADGCSIHVNSNDPEALRQVGTGNAEADSFCVNGDFAGSNYTPMPSKKCRQENDPLKEDWLQHWTDAAIDTTACDYDQTYIDNLFSGGGGSTHVLRPGVYCGTLTIGNGDTAILMEEGDDLFVFVDGGISTTGGGTLRNKILSTDVLPPEPAGVTYPAVDDEQETAIILVGNNPVGELDIKNTGPGNANVILKAKSSGPFAGIAISQHPDAAFTSSSQEHLITGGGTIQVDGIVYFPSQSLRITGGGIIGDTSSQFAIIADTIEVEGNGTLEIRIGADYASAGLPELPESSEMVRLSK